MTPFLLLPHSKQIILRLHGSGFFPHSENRYSISSVPMIHHNVPEAAWYCHQNTVCFWPVLTHECIIRGLLASPSCWPAFGSMKDWFKCVSQAESMSMQKNRTRKCERHTFILQSQGQNWCIHSARFVCVAAVWSSEILFTAQTHGLRNIRCAIAGIFPH